MTLQQFNILKEDNQHRYLLTKGVCIASRETKDNCILLFQVDNFYVELHFDQNFGEINYSRSFEDTDELYPYLDQIEIPLLF